MNKALVSPFWSSTLWGRRSELMQTHSCVNIYRSEGGLRRQICVPFFRRNPNTFPLVRICCACERRQRVVRVCSCSCITGNWQHRVLMCTWHAPCCYVPPPRVCNLKTKGEVPDDGGSLQLFLLCLFSEISWALNVKMTTAMLFALVVDHLSPLTSWSWLTQLTVARHNYFRTAFRSVRK